MKNLVKAHSLCEKMRKLWNICVGISLAGILYLYAREPKLSERALYYAERNNEITWAFAITYPEICLEDPYVFCISVFDDEGTENSKKEIQELCFDFFERNRQLQLYPGNRYPEFNIKEAYIGKFEAGNKVKMQVCRLSERDDLKRI